MKIPITTVDDLQLNSIELLWEQVLSFTLYVLWSQFSSLNDENYNLHTWRHFKQIDTELSSSYYPESQIMFLIFNILSLFDQSVKWKSFGKYQLFSCSQYLPRVSAMWLASSLIQTWWVSYKLTAEKFTFLSTRTLTWTMWGLCVPPTPWWTEERPRYWQ